MPRESGEDEQRDDFWSRPASELLGRLGASEGGLSASEAQSRLARYGANRLREKERHTPVLLLLGQFKSPIILILILAAGLSFFVHDHVDGGIILGIVLVSGALGFWQEKGATDAVQRLLAMIRIEARVLRDGNARDVSIEEIVPGDIVLLGAGDLVPGDSRLLDAKDLFVDEATLTGETFAAKKEVGEVPIETALARRSNTLFLGTHVVSGSARALVVHTGRETEFGRISERLKFRPPETEFEHGVRHFGYFLMEVTLVLLVAIFAVNVLLNRPALDAFLFSLALAVGMTPQLLPAVISVNLAHGSRRMARRKVIVKRLAAIENFGSMDVLCSDKTGTLTEGVVRVHAAMDPAGVESAKVRLYATANACLQTGFVNPIDTAIRAESKIDLSVFRKLDEVPYDFTRKRLSILIETGGRRIIITKGAVDSVLGICSQAEIGEEKRVPLSDVREGMLRQRDELGAGGFRILAVAYRELKDSERVTRDDEREMTLLGYLTLSDVPKAGIAQTLAELRDLGITLKIITGDSRAVAMRVGQEVGLPNPVVLSSEDLRHMSDVALAARAPQVDVFAEVEPNHKERIISALRRTGHVVGFLGDGVNDASALRAADVGISVNTAADVAKQASDIVLLEKDLEVLVAGVREGRATFANTLKYVFMATSANFGNMFSMAGASLFLPFLPLLPKQVLLTNLLTDFPEMTISTDRVDSAWIERPRRWNVKFIRNFMMVFGLLSSIFDFATFGVLMLVYHSSTTQFRTGWFVESVVSATLIVLVVRTRKTILQSLPGRYLTLATMLVVAATVVLPWTPAGRLFGFAPLKPALLAVVAGIVLAYVAAAEAAKHFFYKRTGL